MYLSLKLKYLKAVFSLDCRSAVLRHVTVTGCDVFLPKIPPGLKSVTEQLIHCFKLAECHTFQALCTVTFDLYAGYDLPVTEFSRAEFVRQVRRQQQHPYPLTLTQQIVLKKLITNKSTRKWPLIPRLFLPQMLR